MKVSVVISACDSREDLWERSLYTYSRQTLDKNEFEIVVIDDADRKEFKNLCIAASINYKINFQYITIDPSKSTIPIQSFTPALTNNVGFKRARGEVVVVTGPETLIYEDNLNIACTLKDKDVCAYGFVFRASDDFNHHISNSNWNMLSFYDFSNARRQERLQNVFSASAVIGISWSLTKNIYLKLAAWMKDSCKACGEDDDFSNRMRMIEVIPTFDHRMIGIHQDHFTKDIHDNHNVRFSDKWDELKAHNYKLLQSRLNGSNPVANQDIEWGSDQVIKSIEIF